jgi:hypothetical protein
MPTRDPGVFNPGVGVSHARGNGVGDFCNPLLEEMKVCLPVGVRYAFPAGGLTDLLIHSIKSPDATGQPLLRLSKVRGERIDIGELFMPHPAPDDVVELYVRIAVVGKVELQHFRERQFRFIGVLVHHRARLNRLRSSYHSRLVELHLQKTGSEDQKQEAKGCILYKAFH